MEMHKSEVILSVKLSAIKEKLTGKPSGRTFKNILVLSSVFSMILK